MSLHELYEWTEDFLEEARHVDELKNGNKNAGASQVASRVNRPTMKSSGKRRARR